MIKKLEDILAKYRALSEQMADPAVIADPEKWTKCAKEHSDCSESAEKYLEYKKVEKEMEDAFAAAETETDAEMKDMLVQEGYACKEKLAAINAELRILLLPKDKNDERNVVMEIRGGAGGEEANLFAAELFRMYQHYAESMRWKLDIIDMSDTELGGMKEVVFSVSGKGVYSKLKYESGVHRVQRVPETESQGRVHTSTVTVAVLPEAEDVDVEINEKDLKIDTYRSGGAGGQHVNKTESCIRLTHLPTGIVVTCQKPRKGDESFKEPPVRLLQYQISERIFAEQKKSGGHGRQERAHPHLQFPAEPRHRPQDRADAVLLGQFHARRHFPDDRKPCHRRPRSPAFVGRGSIRFRTDFIYCQ